MNNIYSKTQVFKVNDTGTISQTERNQLKTTLQTMAIPVLEQLFDAEFVEGSDGLIMLLPNDVEGCIPVQVDFKIKNLNYDYDTAHQDLLDKRAIKAQKEAEKAKKAAKAKEKAAQQG